jgi:hypothetical protein
MSQMDGMHRICGKDWNWFAGCIASVQLNLLFWFENSVIGVFVLCLSDIVQGFSMCQQQIPNTTYQIILKVKEGEIKGEGTYKL